MYKDEVAKRYEDKLNNELEYVPEFITRFFDSKPKLKSKLSHFQYWNIYKNFFNYLIEKNIIKKESIQQLTIEDIQGIKETNISQYLNYCETKLNNSPFTVESKLNTLKSLFSYFLADKIIDDNITRKISLKKPQQKEIEFVDLKEKNELINNLYKIKNEFNRLRNIAIVELLYGSGVRISECCGIDIDDLFLVDGHPFIKVIRKGGNTDVVPIVREAYKAIERYIEVRNSSERVCDKNKHILFISETTDKNTGYKARMSENAIRKFIEKWSDNKINPHMFRSGFAMAIVNDENGGFDMAAQLLGHANSTIVRKHYARINNEKTYAVLDRLNKGVI